MSVPAEVQATAPLDDTAAPARDARRDRLRSVLLVAAVLVIVALLVYGGFSVFAADPMAGT